MLKVGVTGGIGSGKSTVTAMLESLGAAVYNSDQRAKALMVEDANVIASIKELLGESAYTAQGVLDRAYIASRVFADKALLDRLNAIVHPVVARDFDRWADTMQQQGYAYVVQEAAILIESGAYRSMDLVVEVSAPVELRVERTCRRDQQPAAAVLQRLKAQMDSDEREKYADCIIYADERRLLIPQVLALHERLMDRAR